MRLQFPLWRNPAFPDVPATVKALDILSEEPNTEYFDAPLSCENGPSREMAFEFAREMAWERWIEATRNPWVRNGYIGVDKPGTSGPDQWFLLSALSEKGLGALAALRAGLVFDLEAGEPDRAATLEFWRNILRKRRVPFEHVALLSAARDVEWMRPVLRDFVLFRLAGETGSDGSVSLPPGEPHPLKDLVSQEG